MPCSPGSSRLRRSRWRSSRRTSAGPHKTRCTALSNSTVRASRSRPQRKSWVAATSRGPSNPRARRTIGPRRLERSQRNSWRHFAPPARGQPRSPGRPAAAPRTFAFTRRQATVANDLIGAVAGYQQAASKLAKETNEALERILAALRETNRSFPNLGSSVMAAKLATVVPLDRRRRAIHRVAGTESGRRRPRHGKKDPEHRDPRQRSGTRVGRRLPPDRAEPR